MICLNYDIFRDLCIKHNLEPADSVFIYGSPQPTPNQAAAIWGKSINGLFIKIATFSPIYGVKINAPFKVTNKKWDGIWGVWMLSYDEVEERFSLMEKNIKLMEIDKRIKDIDKDFLCKNC